MSNEASRQEFEAWARSFGCSFKTTGYAPYDYCNADVQLLWRSWQASRKALEAEQATECSSDEWLANCPQSVRDLANKIKQAQTVEPPTMSFESLIGTTQHRPVFFHPAPPPAEPTVKKPLSTERAGLINTPEKVREFFGSNFDSLRYGREDKEPDEDDKYTMSAHDIIAAFDWSADMLEADVSLINEGNKAKQVAVPYGWMIQGSSQVWFGEYAELDANAEAMRCGGTCIAFAIYIEQVAVPAGFVLVPIVPTPEMIVAGRNAPCVAEDETEQSVVDDYSAVYKAMLSAAPQPPQGDTQ